MRPQKSKAVPFTKTDLLNEQLNEIIVSFGLAMQRAERNFIATRGKFTPSMETAWMRYVEWCQTALKEAA